MYNSYEMDLFKMGFSKLKPSFLLGTFSGIDQSFYPLYLDRMILESILSLDSIDGKRLLIGQSQKFLYNKEVF